jgi:hypothetical protein
MNLKCFQCLCGYRLPHNLLPVVGKETKCVNIHSSELGSVVKCIRVQSKFFEHSSLCALSCSRFVSEVTAFSKLYNKKLTLPNVIS